MTMCSTIYKFTNKEVPLVLPLRIGVTPHQIRLNGIELIRNEIGDGLKIRIRIRGKIMGSEQYKYDRIFSNIRRKIRT